ncbi:potassium channel family protein [Klenkia sp. PcliD-1-E]|nr:potassium channel family protein [Klenkia sp. PcliD-1-E]
MLHPTGSGVISTTVARAFWRTTRARSSRLMQLAGPLSMVAIIATWILILVSGWVLIYLPNIPESFVYGSGLSPSQRSPIVDALYFSLVTVATLGFGDIVPVAGALRVLVPVEALMGFALFTASITWILQVYPALGRRRAVAMRLHLLFNSNAQTESLPVIVLHSLAASIVEVVVDFKQYAETYYFHDAIPTSLAAALPRTLTFAQSAASKGDDAHRAAGVLLEGSLRELSSVLDAQYLKIGGSPDAIFIAYQRDHDQQP